ncbi:MAG: glycosyltransferase family 39 protein [Patescibacteria group bacterium]|nr:glycosyltransferase family 39 protein [Patescibacteria group bacterium]
MNSKIKKFTLKNLWFWPLIIGFVLRLYKITSSSIWHDEGYTMWLLKYDILGILERTARDVHPPGYYLMAKPWTIIFGSSEFSIRFLSLIFSLGIVYFVFKIIKEVWSEKAAFWASLFTALSPFMVRFGQEARMYGVVAFFTTLATYYLVKIIKEKNYKLLFLYVPSMLAAMYTQYYAFFVIISHWVIFSFFTKGFWNFRWLSAIKTKEGLFNYKWWLANVALLVGYLPWFSVAYSQVTRVSDSYWIKPEWITFRTIPNNVLQFFLYSHLDKLYDQNKIIGVIVWTLLVLIAIFGGVYIFKEKSKRKVAASLYLFGFLPMVMVYIASKLATPIYQDRYFPFSAVAIFAIWGVAISIIKNKKVKYGFAFFAVGILLYGNYYMHKDVNHQMKALTKTVKTQSQEGDLLVSGELYTHLDGSYYLGYGDLYFMSEPVDGYGETSLYYDQQEKYILNESQVSQHERVWLIGKSGKGYWDNKIWDDYDSAIYFDSAGLQATLYTKADSQLP